MTTLAFSDAVKRVFAESRLIALDLGYDYIASIHFFLADCQLFPLSSCKSLVFKNDRDFQSFRTSLRIGHPLPSVGSVPLLVETEHTLKAAKQVGKAYADSAVHPCHLFIGASQVLTSSFSNLLASVGLTAEDVKSYYMRTGQLQPLTGTGQRNLSSWWQAVRGYKG